MKLEGKTLRIKSPGTWTLEHGAWGHSFSSLLTLLRMMGNIFFCFICRLNLVTSTGEQKRIIEVVLLSFLVWSMIPKKSTRRKQLYQEKKMQLICKEKK